MFVDEDEDTIVIELYAQQFNWKARYSGNDNVLGKANVRFIEGANAVGVDLADPYAQDDIVVTELHIPKGKKSFQDAFSRCTTFSLHALF
jgi:cytochrome c oxidase subunit 2